MQQDQPSAVSSSEKSNTKSDTGAYEKFKKSHKESKVNLNKLIFKI